MCLKLHLLGGDAITKFDDKEYLIFNNKKLGKILNLNQNKVFRNVKKMENLGTFASKTTGSGKTIVYFKQIEGILKGYQAIILFRNRTYSEFEKKFEEFFGFKAIWHWGQHQKEKIIWVVSHQD